MSGSTRSNFILGLVLVAFSAVLLFVWIPLDTDTGYIEKVRRQVTVGDAAAPSIAALFLLTGGLLLIFVERARADQPAFGRRHLVFVLSFVGWTVLSLLVMRYAGPALVAVLGMDMEYRLLRDTLPWKYVGFLIGGTMLISGGISMVEGRVRPQRVLLSLVITTVMMLIYDVPFEDLLLPPNGDV